MSAAYETPEGVPSPERRHRRRRRPVLRWIVIALVAVLFAVGMWIVVRGLLARDALLGAAPLVQHARDAVLGGDPEAAQRDLAEVQERTATAAGLTSDPVWRLVELVPLVGPNLTAFREAASVVDEVASDALPPLAEVAAGLDFSSFVPSGGRLDVQPLIDARPLLAEGAAAMDAALARASEIRTGSTIPQIGEAVDQLVDLVEETAGLVGGVAGAAEILPGMLGYDGPRDYLLLVLTNAELRAAGGIPGALAVVHADQGRLSLGEQTSAASFGERDEPLPITEAERTIYSDNLGLFMQNVTATPDFTRTAELATQRWSERYGSAPDGVISVDPVALSYVLRATGPIDLGDGIALDADNAVEFLLSGVYERFDRPADQDAFFSRAFARVFDRLAAGSIEPQPFVDALVQAGSERRILVWSGREAEQAVIARGSISGPTPVSTDDRTGIGVYLHDSTESKMDWYLQPAITISSVECRNDDRPYFEVRVRLLSTAPEDAAAVLPDYVLGTEDVVDHGRIRTGVVVYLPPGSTVYESRIDEQPWAFSLAEDGENVIAAQVATLDPGQAAVVSFHVLGPLGSPLGVALDHTPGARPIPVSTGNMLACPQL